MKLYDSLGPNPRLVRMFAAEKGIDLELIAVDLPSGENRRPDYLARNPYGQLPALELDDGSVIAETTAICEYLEEVQPQPSLVGESARERAETRMWTRRIEQTITAPMSDGFRFGEGLAMFEGRMRTLPQAADDLKAIGREGLEKLDGLMAASGSDYVCGDRFSLADLVLYALTDFLRGVGQPIDPSLEAISCWRERVGSRESAGTSLHPAAQTLGMRG